MFSGNREGPSAPPPHTLRTFWDVVNPISCFRRDAFLEERLGKLKVQEKSFAHVGMERAQREDFSASLTREDFTKNLKFLPTSPELRAGRREPLSLEPLSLELRAARGGPLVV